MDKVREALEVLKEHDCLAKTSTGVSLRGVAVSHAKELLSTRNPQALVAHRKLMDYIIRVTTPWLPGRAEDRKPVGVFYSKNSQRVKELLTLAKGDPDLAIAGFDSISTRMERNGLSWTLNTVVQHFPEWASDPLGYDRGTK